MDHRERASSSRIALTAQTATALLALGLTAALLPACEGDETGPRAPDTGSAWVYADATVEAPDATVETPDAGVEAPDAGAAPTPYLAVLDVERPVDVTSDGKTALVWQQSTGELLFFDVATRTLTLKTTLELEGLQTQQPNALSRSGRIAAIYGFQPDEAGLWDETNGWLKLGSPLPGCVDDTQTPAVVNNRGGAFDVSDDGHVAVGLLWLDCSTVQAFRWTDAAGAGAFTLLDRLGVGPDLTTPSNNRATVVSADGLVAGGWAYNGVVDRSPAVWRADGTGFLLDPADMMLPGEVLAISADGSVMGGIWARATGGLDGFVWSEAGGVTRFGPTVDADLTSMFPRAMTADGRVVLGRWSFQPSFFDPADDHAFVWSQAGGLRKLADIAAAQGLTIPADTRLSSVQGVSAEGTVVVGEALLPPLPDDPLMLPVMKTYVLVLPAGALD